jgi:hypothetical protein
MCGFSHFICIKCIQLIYKWVICVNLYALKTFVDGL